MARLEFVKPRVERDDLYMVSDGVNVWWEKTKGPPVFWNGKIHMPVWDPLQLAISAAHVPRWRRITRIGLKAAEARRAEAVRRYEESKNALR